MMNPSKIYEVWLRAKGTGSYVDRVSQSMRSFKRGEGIRTRALFIDQGDSVTLQHIYDTTEGGVFLLSLLKPQDLDKLNSAIKWGEEPTVSARLTYAAVTFKDDYFEAYDFFTKEDISEEILEAGRLTPHELLEDLPKYLLCTNYFYTTQLTDLPSSVGLPSFEPGLSPDKDVALVPFVKDTTVLFGFCPKHRNENVVNTRDGVLHYSVDGRISAPSPLSTPALFSYADIEHLKNGRCSPALLESIRFFEQRTVSFLKNFVEEGDDPRSVHEIALNAVGLSYVETQPPFSLTEDLEPGVSLEVL